jgi:glycosyltransferase involved in cell wall biosynthesis
VPSTWDEPFGYAAAEAMAMGRPLVVTPAGALPELCGDDRGFVAGSRDPASLAAVLRQALSDRPERLARAQRGRELADNQLTAESVGLAYEALYREVAS